MPDLMHLDSLGPRIATLVRSHRRHTTQTVLIVLLASIIVSHGLSDSLQAGGAMGEMTCEQAREILQDKDATAEEREDAMNLVYRKARACFGDAKDQMILLLGIAQTRRDEEGKNARVLYNNLWLQMMNKREKGPYAWDHRETEAIDTRQRIHDLLYHPDGSPDDSPGDPR